LQRDFQNLINTYFQKSKKVGLLQQTNVNLIHKIEKFAHANRYLNEHLEETIFQLNELRQQVAQNRKILKKKNEETERLKKRNQHLWNQVHFFEMQNNFETHIKPNIEKLFR